MNLKLVAALAACATALLAYDTAQAQPLEDVTVEARRTVTEVVGKSAIGAPIKQVTVSYVVNFADLDLATTKGMDTLGQRVKDAAEAACKELEAMHPFEGSPDRNCEKRSYDQAMKSIPKQG